MVNFQKFIDTGRERSVAKSGDEDLGPFRLLAEGVWKSENRGWNMIALPFADGQHQYRLLLNQYKEDLTFPKVVKGVLNRGIDPQTGAIQDQTLVGLDYEQAISQIAAADQPRSGQLGNIDGEIHHEPGLFLHMSEPLTNGLDIARLATIPHGDSVLAMGKAEEHIEGPPIIDEISGLPIGGTTDLDHSYLSPYNFFHENPFIGVFDPTLPNALLNEANEELNIIRHTRLHFDTKLESGGIINIPFIVKQANATEMTSTFWISEIENDHGDIELQLQYSQTVMLDFFDRTDGEEGLIKWPHVSINTLRKVG